MTNQSPRAAIAFFDTECYRNFWLLKLRPRGGPVFSWAITNGQRFSNQQIAEIVHAFTQYTVVSFYGNGYDKWMIAGAIAGFTTDQLKWLNDQLIVHKAKPWELGLPRWEPDDHIDIMEVVPGAGSQKQFAGRIHYVRMQDLPYSPDSILTFLQMLDVDSYCGNDLGQLEALYDAVLPMIELRIAYGKRFGLDLRSKSDAQVAEAVLKKQCEIATGARIGKPVVDWNMRFMYRVPDFISFQSPQLLRVLEMVRSATFSLSAAGAVVLPPQIEGLEFTIGSTTYRMGIGGLHSKEQKLIVLSDDDRVVRMPDVTGYYPNLIVNSGEYPSALGPEFRNVYRNIKDERTIAKHLGAKLKKSGDTSSPAYIEAKTLDGGGKIMSNGTFGKTGSPFSVLFAPTMLIQTTLTGQCSLAMLIEWHEAYGIPVVSANTDGIVIHCPRDRVHISEWLIEQWSLRTGLAMETEEYLALYARDVNNYYAIPAKGDVKRKGEYARASLIDKKNPDVEICSDAVEAFLARGVPIEQTIVECKDIRKFVTIQKVDGGGVKLWGDGPMKGDLVRDMIPTIIAHGWIKDGRKWTRGGLTIDARSAYTTCFDPQRAEPLGKVCRWYYGTNSPGPIVYARNGNTVGMSYGSCPCMTLPDKFPDNVDFVWYVTKSINILRDLGYFVLDGQNKVSHN